MDKISRFRRKPKRPTIETSVVRSRSSEPPPLPQEQANSSPTSIFSPRSPLAGQGPMSRVSGRISPFRNIRLLGAGKRARSTPPAGQGQHQTSRPSTAVVAKGGHPLRNFASRDGMNEAARMDHKNGTASPAAVQMPGFLSQPFHELGSKYQELVWAERNRVAEGMRTEDINETKWAQYRPTHTTELGNMDRYANVKPWYHNRVKLDVQEGIDYVNASAIVLPPPTDESQEPLRYIAMQGPTIPSFEYVWRMIAEQMSQTSSIVQLTSMVEGGAIKCHQYFPLDFEEESTWALNEEDIWGDGWRATLTYDSLESVMDGAIEKRKLLLHVEGEDQPRVVWHFLYQRWPDFGVPELDDLNSFFEVMRLSREHSDPNGTRIVHCSAGVGRTGTFICLEHLMRELDAGAFDGDGNADTDEDPVFDIVDLLREQRRGMVQGTPQYIFIYDVLRKLWRERHGIADTTGEPASKRLEVPDPASFDSSDSTSGTRTPAMASSGRNSRAS